MGRKLGAALQCAREGHRGLTGVLAQCGCSETVIISRQGPELFSFWDGHLDEVEVGLKKQVVFKVLAAGVGGRDASIRVLWGQGAKIMQTSDLGRKIWGVGRTGGQSCLVGKLRGQKREAGQGCPDARV